MGDHRTQVTTCPVCKAVHDAALNATGDRPPAPFDLCVCAGCASALVYDEEMQLRLLDKASLPPEIQEVLERIQDSMRELNKRRQQ